MPYAKPVVLYTFDSNGTNSGTGGSNNNAIINGTSVIDTSIANIKIGTGSMFIASGGSTEANSVEIGNMNLSTSAFTISFWLKMNVSSTTDDSHLFHAYYNNSSSDYFLRSNGPGHTSLTLSSSASTVTRTPQVSYNNDSFHHFVITCNSGVHTLYIDNISNTPMNTSPFSGNFNRFRIGGPLRTAGSTIGNGNIDDFRFYNYAADATFVSYLYKLGSNTDIASLSSVAIADLVAAGASVSQLVATGKPVAEIIFYSQWLDLSATSNVFNKTYVNNFVDLSGVMNIRNNSDLVVYGNWMVGGNINTLANNAIIINDMNILSRLFTNSDISVNGNLSMGGDLSVNGQFNSNFADGVIPYNSILFASAGSETVIQGNVKILGDVSFSSPSLELGGSTILQVNGNIIFNDGSQISTHTDNILQGSYAAGNVIFKDSLFNSVTVNQNVYIGGSLYTSSDYRIKTNVTTLCGSYTIDALNPVQYYNSLNGNHEYGFIAHELQSVYPDMVVGDKNGPEYQSVIYTNLIGVLVKEVQELKHRLNLLDSL